MKRIWLLIIALIMPIFLMASADVQNISITGNCYAPGQRVVVTFEVKCGAWQKVYGDILFSTDSTPDFTDYCVWASGGAKNPPIVTDHTGEIMFDNNNATSDWHQVSFSIIVPSNLTGNMYLIVNVGENSMALGRWYTYYDRTLNISLNSCGYPPLMTYTPTRMITPTSTITPTPVILPGCGEPRIGVPKVNLQVKVNSLDAQSQVFAVRIYNYEYAPVNLSGFSIKLWLNESGTENMATFNNNTGWIHENMGYERPASRFIGAITRGNMAAACTRDAGHKANQFVVFNFGGTTMIPAAGGYFYTQGDTFKMGRNNPHMDNNNWDDDYSRESTGSWVDCPYYALYYNGIMVSESLSAFYNNTDPNTGMAPCETVCTATSTKTPTSTQTFTETVTPTVTQTITETFSNTATLTRTTTVTGTRTWTQTITKTFTPTFTFTRTATSTFTVTVTITETYIPACTQTPPPDCGSYAEFSFEDGSRQVYSRLFNDNPEYPTLRGLWYGDPNSLFAPIFETNVGSDISPGQKNSTTAMGGFKKLDNMSYCTNANFCPCLFRNPGHTGTIEWKQFIDYQKIIDEYAANGGYNVVWFSQLDEFPHFNMYGQHYRFYITLVTVNPTTVRMCFFFTTKNDITNLYVGNLTSIKDSGWYRFVASWKDGIFVENTHLPYPNNPLELEQETVSSGDGARIKMYRILNYNLGIEKYVGSAQTPKRLYFGQDYPTSYLALGGNATAPNHLLGYVDDIKFWNCIVDETPSRTFTPTATMTITPTITPTYTYTPAPCRTIIEYYMFNQNGNGALHGATYALTPVGIPCYSSDSFRGDYSFTGTDGTNRGAFKFPPSLETALAATTAHTLQFLVKTDPKNTVYPAANFIWCRGNYSWDQPHQGVFEYSTSSVWYENYLWMGYNGLNATTWVYPDYTSWDIYQLCWSGIQTKFFKNGTLLSTRNTNVNVFTNTGDFQSRIGIDPLDILTDHYFRGKIDELIVAACDANGVEISGNPTPIPTQDATDPCVQ